MSEWKKWLRQAVVRARESCCGDSPKDKRPLLKLIGRCTSICFDYNVPTQITKKLEQAYQIVNESKDYYGRLPADNILCDLLNNELGD